MTNEELDLLTSLQKAFPSESTEVLLLRKLISLGGTSVGDGGGTGTYDADILAKLETIRLLNLSIESRAELIRVSNASIDGKITAMHNGLNAQLVTSNYHLNSINFGVLIDYATDGGKIYKMSFCNMANGGKRFTFERLQPNGNPDGIFIVDTSEHWVMSISNNILTLHSKLGTYRINHLNINTYNKNPFTSTTESALELLNHLNDTIFVSA